jgi:hypothetical protein
LTQPLLADEAGQACAGVDAPEGHSTFDTALATLSVLTIAFDVYGDWRLIATTFLPETWLISGGLYSLPA